MSGYEGAVVAVTGAARGLGRETALAFARSGAAIAACDVDRAGLEALAADLREMGRESLMEEVDVADAKAVDAFRDAVLSRFGRVDVLVNNAGVVVGGSFESVSLSDWEWIVGVNLNGVVNCCHSFYPGMVDRGRGHIVNVSSAAALAPLPLIAPYSMTKRAVLAFSRVFRGEAAYRGVNVTTVCPGFVSTGITARMKLCSGAGGRGGEETAQRVHRLLSRRNVPPERVAESIVDAVRRNKGVALIGWEARLLDAFYRLSRTLYDAFLCRLHRHL